LKYVVACNVYGPTGVAQVSASDRVDVYMKLFTLSLLYNLKSQVANYQDTYIYTYLYAYIYIYGVYKFCNLQSSSP
jgi:hypothetical protein